MIRSINRESRLERVIQRKKEMANVTIKARGDKKSKTHSGEYVHKKRELEEQDYYDNSEGED